MMTEIVSWMLATAVGMLFAVGLVFLNHLG